MELSSERINSVAVVIGDWNTVLVSLLDYNPSFLVIKQHRDPTLDNT